MAQGDRPEGALIGTLSGAALGFAGGFLTQLVLEHEKRAAENKKRKADKLPDLALALYEHEYWIYSFQDIVKDDLLATLAKALPPPISKMLSISNIYFPEL